MMKVASIQLFHNDADSKADRIKHAEDMIDKAAGADLVMLPETWNVGFSSFDLWEQYSEPLTGETITRMSKKAKQHNAYILAGSIIERGKDNCLRNTAVFLNRKGEIIATFSKMHLVGFAPPGVPQALEKTLAKPGKDTVAVKTDLGVFGFAICYDIFFPEMFRKMAIQQGVECFLFIAGWAITILDNWRALTQARATENVCWLVSCGGTGLNRGRCRPGHSAIIDPLGIPIVEGRAIESIVRGEFDPTTVHEIRKNLPYLEDRVLYKPL